MQLKTLMTAGATALSILVGGTAMAQEVFLRMEAPPPGTSAGQVAVAFTQIAQRLHPDYSIQVSVGAPATRSAVNVAMQRADLFMNAESINFYMQSGTAMFAEVPNAAELNGDLRNILNFELGPLHMVVYAESGIESLSDLRGRRIYVGPPGSAGARIYQQVIEAATGLTPDDYEVMRFDWAAAETAFIDRQMDFMAISTTLPSPTIQQYASVSPIRLLGLSEEALASPAMQPVLTMPGRSVLDIPAGVYSGQVNEEAVTTIGAWASLATNRFQDEEVIYNMTRAFWENIDDAYATADWMRGITRETALLEMNIPLHIGAYRYYVEAGFDIPESAIPPEAR